MAVFFKKMSYFSVFMSDCKTSTVSREPPEAFSEPQLQNNPKPGRVNPTKAKDTQRNQNLISYASRNPKQVAFRNLSLAFDLVFMFVQINARVSH